MTIVIVEGCDLAGKTYFIERFAKYMNSGITIKNNFKPHNKDTSEQIYNQYHKILELSYNFALTTERLVILDRFFPSQAVYSFFRGVDESTDPRIQHLERESKNMGVKIIYLDTPLSEILKRYDERGDEYIKKSDLLNIHTRYQHYLDSCPLPILKLNTLEDGWMKKAEEFVNGKNK